MDVRVRAGCFADTYSSRSLLQVPPTSSFPPFQLLLGVGGAADLLSADRLHCSYFRGEEQTMNFSQERLASGDSPIATISWLACVSPPFELAGVLPELERR